MAHVVFFPGGGGGGAAASSGSYVPAFTNLTGQVNLVAGSAWRWQRIGSIVMLQGSMDLSLLPGPGSGTVDVSLPFPVAAGLVRALATNNGTPFTAGSSQAVQVSTLLPSTISFNMAFSGIYVGAEITCVATYEAV